MKHNSINKKNIRDKLDKEGLCGALAFIGNTYAEKPSLLNGYAKLGSILLERKRIDSAFQAFEKDYFGNRLSPDYRAIFAFVLAASKKHAQAKIEIQRAFLEDPSLVKGHWLVDIESGVPCLFFDEAAADQKVNYDKFKHAQKGITGFYNFLQFLHLKEFDRSIEKAYASDTHLTDCFAHIGGILTAFARYDRALEYFSKDFEAGRLSHPKRIQFARLIALFGKNQIAEQEIAFAYDEDPEISDGYALIGCAYRNCRQDDIALEYFELDNNLMRLSPPFRHIFADQLARAERFEEAETEVERGYASDPSLKNGFARIGNILRVKGDFDQAFSLYSRDYLNNRLTSNHLLIYVELLLRRGDIQGATKVVESAYSIDLLAKDGFSKIGNIFKAKGDLDTALSFYRRDDDLERLYSSFHRCAYAELLSRSSNLTAAVKIIDSAYEIYPALKDGYARVGWQHYWNRGCYNEVLDYIYRDLNADRLSVRWFKNYALALAAVGMLDEAISVVERVYSRNKLAKDFFADIGWHFYTTLKEIRGPLDLLERDARSHRLSPAGMLKLAELLTRQANIDIDLRGLLERALELVVKAYEWDGTLKDGYSRVARGLIYNDGVTEDLEMLYQRDLDQGRMSQRCFVEYICYLSIIKNDLNVADEISRIYQLYPEFEGGYAALASELAKRNLTERALLYYEYDHSHGKLPSDSAVRYVQLLIYLKKEKEINALLEHRLDQPDVYRYQALSAVHAKPTTTDWPVPTVPVLKNADIMQAGRILVAMAQNHPVSECIDFAQTLYKRRVDLMDCLCSGARSARANNDVEKAIVLYEEDRRLGRARAESMLEYVEILFSMNKHKAEKVLDETLTKYPFQPEPWLSRNHNRHKGERCFVVGTGPSMTQIDCSLLSSETVIAVNGAIFIEKLNPTYFVSVSNVFWRHHTQAIRALECRRFLPFWLRGLLDSNSPTSWINAPMPRSIDESGQPADVPQFFSEHAERFISLGGTVIFACLQLAWYLGFQEVVLLGVDHNYGDGIREFSKNVNLRTDQVAAAHCIKNYYGNGIFNLDFPGMERAYKLGSDHYRADGRRILNATPGTKLTIFPTMKLEALL